MIRKVPGRSQKKIGFTLIEIMLALLVVSIGIVAMIGLLGTSLDSSAKAHDDLSVVSFADMVFNYCHSVTNWDEITTSGTLLVPDYAGNDNALPIGSIAQFDCQVANSAGSPKNTFTVSYILDIDEDANRKELSLRIWPGISTNGSKRVFYTEIYNWMKN